MASGNVTCTGPVVPWYDAMEAAPLACCCALGAENVSACEVSMYERNEISRKAPHLLHVREHPIPVPTD